jgi:tetratricopeptide (TPR) repeat protein
VVAAAVAGIGVLATRRTESPPPAPPQTGVTPEQAIADEGAAGVPSDGWEQAGKAAGADTGALAGTEAAQGTAPGSREEQIAGGLARARQAVAELRLTTPESDSAMFHYQQVLSLDPENVEAREGVRDIVLRYVSLSDSAAASGNRAQAATYLERAASISPNDPEVIAARARLASAPPEAPGRQAPTLRAEPRAPREEAQKATPPRWTNFPQVKQAYRAGHISKGEYNRVVNDLERQRDNEIRNTKLDYRAARISRDEYERKIRAIKLRYAGRQY